MGKLKISSPKKNYLQRMHARDKMRLEEILRRHFGDTAVGTLNTILRRKESPMQLSGQIRGIQDIADRREALQLLGLIS